MPAPPAASPPEEGVCESCAAEDEELSPVWPTAAGTEADAPQLWCADCRDRYPNEPADDE